MYFSRYRFGSSRFWPI